MAVSNEKLASIIEIYSTQKYFIEHTQWRSNHISHGIVALYKLGCDEKGIEEFAKRYGGKCEPAIKWGSDQPRKEYSKEELTALLGKRTNYYDLVSHYQNLLTSKYENNVLDFVSGEIPKMAKGLHVAALHPLIQCGYGLSIGNATMVTEAMAYFHFSYFPHASMKTFDTIDQKNIVDILDDVRNDISLYDGMITEAKNPDWMPWYSGSFQRKLGILVANDFLFTRIQQYVSMIRFPDWFHKESASISEVRKLMDWTLEMALTVYVCAEKRNDFFLLHGVTSAWALTKVLEAIKDPQEAFGYIRYFLCILIGSYLAQDRPALNLTYLDVPTLANKTIEDICKEVLCMTVDEHVYKLVQICYELSKKKEVNAEKQQLLKAASRVAMDFKF